MKKTILLAAFAFCATCSSSRAQLLIDEDFSYSNGALTNVAAGVWNWHSGNGGSSTLNVVDGQAHVNQGTTAGGGDDYNRLFAGGVTFDPLTDNSSILFVGFTVNFASLPVVTGTQTFGSYFAHFKSSTANEFYSRIGANLANAESGKFRIAFANEAGFSSVAPTQFNQDLELNTTYLVVARLDLLFDQTTLWVDPVNESSTSATATDTFTYSGVINSYALRQGTSGSGGNQGAPGSVFIDNLKVGTDFVSVIPEPSTVALVAGGLGMLAVSRFRRRK